MKQLLSIHCVLSAFVVHGSAAKPKIVNRLRNKLIAWEKKMGVSQYSDVQ